MEENNSSEEVVVIKKNYQPAQSFRLGEQHRKRLEEVAKDMCESQVDVMRRMIDVAWRANKKKQKKRLEARKAREAEYMRG